MLGRASVYTLRAVSGSSKVISRSTGCPIDDDECISRRGNTRVGVDARNLHSISISRADIGPRPAPSIVSLTSILGSRHHNDIIDWMPFQTAPREKLRWSKWMTGVRKKGNEFHILLIPPVHGIPSWFSTTPINLVSCNEKKRRFTSWRADICMQSTFKKLIGHGYKSDGGLNVNWSIQPWLYNHSRNGIPKKTHLHRTIIVSILKRKKKIRSIISKNKNYVPRGI